jgi:LysR family transcriptional regulator, hydrogen peroxide-inducible genes activator
LLKQNINIMTFTQMEYIAAVEKFGSFVTAADKCNVTQPTLSMQIQKLEDELGVKIFDRNHHPIASTDIGAKIIAQVRNVLFEVTKVHEIIDTNRNSFSGVLTLGILPTLAPYILPKMLSQFLAKYPEVELQIFELPSRDITKQLKEDKLDFAIMGSPKSEKDFKVTPIFNEQFVAFLGDGHKLLAQRNVEVNDLDLSELWTLNDDHCMQLQDVNLLDSNGANYRNMSKLRYQTGTMNSLIKMVETNGGVTLIPELSLEDMYEHQLENIRYFGSPEPTREINIVHNKHFAKNKIVGAFIQLLTAQLPKAMLIKQKTTKIIIAD